VPDNSDEEPLAAFAVTPAMPAEDSQDADDVVELSGASSRPPAQEDGPTEIDLSDAIKALGPSPRTAPAAASAVPGVVDAAGLFERGQQRLERGHTREGLADLEEAARVPAFRFQAAWRLGKEYAAHGHAQAAVEWLERAAEVAAPSREVSVEVLYELGRALQRVGESARALAVFMEIDAEEPGYRDVGRRLDALARVENESRR
jgi:tetratricopeptide (TPR) repeat protein